MSWDVTGLRKPWGSRKSIHAFLAERLCPGRVGLLEEDADLPDELVADRRHWLPGALDGVVARPEGTTGDKTTDDILAAMERLLQASTQRNLDALYRLLVAHHTGSYAEDLLNRLSNSCHHPERIHALATWLAREAPDREPVKLAILMLGWSERSADEALLLTLGWHDEFTAVAGAALAARAQDPDAAVWRLAKGVHGWGRLEAVWLLAESENPDIKAWLLREGFENSVEPGAVAYTCAVAGDLATELAKPEIDDALFDGACALLSGLIGGRDGSFPAVDHYGDAPDATEALLRHAQARALTLKHFAAVAAIRGFLSDRRYPYWLEWTHERRRRLLRLATTICQRPIWRKLATAALEAEDPEVFSQAVSCAEYLGIDTWEALFTRTAAGGDFLHDLLLTEDAGRLARALELARTVLPLDEIATGPAMESGLGPGFEWHAKLDWILYRLERTPGHGWHLIEAGLRSPVVDNRSGAIRALAAWPRAEWPPGAETVVRDCAAQEPDFQLQSHLDRLLKGTPGDFQRIPGMQFTRLPRLE